MVFIKGLLGFVHGISKKSVPCSHVGVFKIGGPNTDPRQYGSHYENTHKQDPPLHTSSYVMYIPGLQKCVKSVFWAAVGGFEQLHCVIASGVWALINYGYSKQLFEGSFSPEGFCMPKAKDMHNRLGLDLLITGHRHDQEGRCSGGLGVSQNQGP